MHYLLRSGVPLAFKISWKFTFPAGNYIGKVRTQAVPSPNWGARTGNWHGRAETGPQKTENVALEMLGTGWGMGHGEKESISCLALFGGEGQGLFMESHVPWSEH